ncbi:amidohydrolase family protein [Streptomyces lincolnensis]|uniref:amidohydrolase family protein n=1 Tax=Streptomyces lincolnensis TaxID=1915 RepID=UPI001E44EF09|nr:amidohydrolase family protein [Streptomyces lincolnensis]MCD7445089.1 amidohydrolase family protein [Streptomyces lincolnensis]
MTVDAHHHVWDLSVRDQDWIGPDSPIRRDFTVADLAPEARAAGVDRTVLVQTITVPEETPEFLALAAAHALIAGVVGWTDLTRPDIADELARLRELPGGRYLKGIRHQVQGEPDPDWLLRPDVRRGLAAVAEAGLVYDLVVLPHQLPACAKAAAALPQLTFVLDHLGKPPIASGALEPWAADVRALAAHPNTVCKLSGMVTEADPASWTVDDLRPYADAVLDAFGPARLMFGSDWPVCTLAAGYGDVLDAARQLVPAREHRQVFEDTAVRVYDL